MSDNCSGNSWTPEWPSKTTHASTFQYCSHNWGWGGLWRGKNCGYVVIPTCCILDRPLCSRNSGDLYTALTVWMFLRTSRICPLVHTFPCLDPQLGMFKHSHSTWHHCPNAAIICANKIVQTCHLLPKFGSGDIPHHWFSGNILNHSSDLFFW